MLNVEIENEIYNVKKLHAEGKSLDAINLLKHIIGNFPETVIAYYLIGQYLRGIARSYDAWSYLQKALQLDPYNQFIYHELGLTAISEGHWSKALRIYQYAFIQRPNNLHKSMMAECLFNLGNNSGSWSIWQNIIEGGHNDIKIYTHMIKICQRLKEDDLLIKIADRSLILYPDHAGVRTSKAEALARLAYFDEAISEMEIVKKTGLGDIYVDSRLRDYERQKVLYSNLGEILHSNSGDDIPESNLNLEKYAAIIDKYYKNNQIGLEEKKAVSCAFAALNRYHEAAFLEAQIYQELPFRDGKSGSGFIQSLIFSKYVADANIEYTRNCLPSNIDAIPKSIVQFWDKDPLPDLQCVMDAWATTNPEYNYELFDDLLAMEFIRKSILKNI